MYAYVVFDPTSERFKFGISNQPHLKRFASYGTAFGSFDGIVISCNNTLEVENALKLKLAHCIVPHASGRPSEVALRGQGDANLKLAFQTLLEVRTLSKSIPPVLPDMGCSTSEEEHDTNSEQLSEEAEDAEGSTQAEPDDDDTVSMNRLGAESAKQTTMKPCRGFPEFGKGKRTASEDWTRNESICRSSRRRRKVVVGEERFATTVKNTYPLCGQCCFKAVQYWDVLKPWFRDAGTLHEEFSADMDSRWRERAGASSR